MLKIEVLYEALQLWHRVAKCRVREGVESTASTGQERNVWGAHRDSQDKGRRKVSQVLMEFTIELCVFVGSGKLLFILIRLLNNSANSLCKPLSWFTWVSLQDGMGQEDLLVFLGNELTISTINIMKMKIIQPESLTEVSC